MDSLNRNLNTHFESWLGPRDKRVQQMLLLDNYLPTFALTVMYLLIVWLGPKYMRHRQAYSCRGLMLLYNLGVTVLSFYMCYQLVSTFWSGGYNFYCQNTYSKPEADIKIINALWWYYFSKLIEFADTFFFILRKNNHQITFLHVYHHASMLNIWWFVMNWIPCGHSYFGASLNSFVHVVMYSYYGLSSIPALRPYLWWKKYITQLQLIQFVLTIWQTACAAVWPCGFPIRWLYFQISYMGTFVLLFSNFYIQTYKKQSASRQKELKNGSSLSTNGHANGTPLAERAASKKLRTD
ncbi:Elongation of very long chain fatty acids protein 5 [Oryzias melastigma]|uniref:Elongation of very long chain fatty acids protein 5 n=1 Tax=Oryzias melastigma TaxID=30732 RepID=A0A3B3B6C8_ORYME|nr:elongation of very long chain fatty acids protein 5 [Oryzias melastigma]KAF6731553.1 Elongation of very long chain fatty acids protein 5 [Oryzias melastigma]